MKIGRNKPCPCGSGKKYKKCCHKREAVAVRITREDRAAALAKLEQFAETRFGPDEDDALDELWEPWDDAEEDPLELMDEPFRRGLDDLVDPWVFFDRPLMDGSMLVDRFLAEAPPVSAGERRYLELCRETCLRPYIVEDVVPGVSITLRDAMTRQRVRVNEKMGSRSFVRDDLMAARIISTGPSGGPEIEQGVLPLPGLIKTALLTQLRDHMERFQEEQPGATDTAFYKEMVPFFHDAFVTTFVNPPIPRLQNTDGEEMLPTRTRYRILDRQALVSALDSHPELEPGSGDNGYSWSGPNRKGDEVSLAWFRLEENDVVLETNSVQRDVRGRELFESLAGKAVQYRGTVHEDLDRSLREALRSGPSAHPPGEKETGIPPEVAEDLVLEHQARHYRGWLDEAIPALGGKTPRQAAGDPGRRQALVDLIRGLEGMYHRALKEGQPAYDPSWMWAELGLVQDDEAERPPPLAHERWAQAEPRMGELVGELARRTGAQPGFDHRESVIAAEQLEADLEVQRLLRDLPAANPGQCEPEQAPARLLCMANLELHHRKIFWVDEALTFMLAQTDLEVVGQDLRLPFPAFALVFTSREVLSLAERLVARDQKCPLAGHMLRVVTVYITERRAGAARALHLAFALDTLGADLPYLVEQDLQLVEDTQVELPGAGPPVLLDGEQAAQPRRPLPGLLHVTLNAILYATSAGVKREVRPGSSQPRKRSAGTSQDPPALSSEEVYFLPGDIEISRLRQLQSLQRVPSGRNQLHRFMVRGHWRRPAASWKDQCLRWIKPYWKGPDLAAIIERTYKMKP